MYQTQYSVELELDCYARWTEISLKFASNVICPSYDALALDWCL